MKDNFKKNDNRRNFQGKRKFDNRREDRKQTQPPIKRYKEKEENEYDDIVEGRNAVLELLNSDRDRNKTTLILRTVHLLTFIYF